MLPWIEELHHSMHAKHKANQELPLILFSYLKFGESTILFFFFFYFFILFYAHHYLSISIYSILWDKIAFYSSSQTK